MGQEITRLQVQLDLTLPKLERTLEDVKRVTDYMLEVDDRQEFFQRRCSIFQIFLGTSVLLMRKRNSQKKFVNTSWN